MSFRQSLAIACATMLAASQGQAAVTAADIDQAIAELQTDSQLISGWITGQLKHAVPFNSTAGAVVPKQLKLLGFELGVEGVVTGTKMDVSGLRNLGTSIINTNEIDTFDTMPFPSAIAHAKIGLPFGLDAGVRFGGIPEKNVDEGDTKVKVENKIFGIDLRKKIIEEGLTRPFGLTVGVNYTHADGDITVTSPFQSNAGPTYENAGKTFTTAYDATGVNRSEWKTDSYGVQAIVNKQIAFINPYVGASVNRNTGDIDSSLTTAGTVTITEQGTSNTVSETETVVGSSHDDPNKWDIRALAGIEFSLLPFLRLGIHGEYAGSKNVGGGLGLRFQFR
jgi:hypothetical protein